MVNSTTMGIRGMEVMEAMGMMMVWEVMVDSRRCCWPGQDRMV
jgi:hypothetical protein